VLLHKSENRYGNLEAKGEYKIVKMKVHCLEKVDCELMDGIAHRTG